MTILFGQFHKKRVFLVFKSLVEKLSAEKLYVSVPLFILKPIKKFSLWNHFVLFIKLLFFYNDLWVTRFKIGFENCILKICDI